MKLIKQVKEKQQRGECSEHEQQEGLDHHPNLTIAYVYVYIYIYISHLHI